MAKLCYTYNGKTYTKSQFEELLEDNSFEQYNDKTWKMEIPDGNLLIQDSSFYEGKTKNIDGGILATLSEVFDSKELFEAYPSIKNMQVIFDKDTAINDGALDGNTIYLPYNQIFVSKDTLKSTIIHEIQHIIQQIEGFSRGGNVYSIYDYIIKELGLPENSLKEQTYENIKNLAERNYNPSNYNEVIESVLEGNSLTFLKKGREVYERLAGEVEARNVERRVDMSIEEKAKYLLSETERVSEADKIYLQDEVNSGIQSLSSKVQNSVENLETTKLVSEYLKDKGFPINILSEQDMIEEARKRGYDSFEAMVTAYHGSPHSFNRFTTEKMGTGEGVQAFGWGLYFTDLESIAKEYARTLTEDKLMDLGEFTIKGFERLDNFDYFSKELSYLGETKRGENALGELKDIHKELKEEIEDLKSSKSKEDIKYIVHLNEQVSLIDYIISKAENRLSNLPKENLYKVSLHKGKTPSEYTWLEWDEAVPTSVLNKLPKTVGSTKYLDKINILENAIKNISEAELTVTEPLYEGDTIKYTVVFGGKILGQSLSYPLIDSYSKVEQKSKILELLLNEAKKEDKKNNSGSNIYSQLSRELGSDKQASLFLLRAGVDGIKFPAESISRGATSDNARGFNYVVFDENAITIDKKIQFLKAGERIHGFYDVNTNEIYLTEELLNSDTLTHETFHYYSKVLEKQAKSGNLIAENLLNRFNEIGIEVLGGEAKLKSYFDNVKTTQPNSSLNFLYVNNKANLTPTAKTQLTDAMILFNEGVNTQDIFKLTNWYLDEKEGWIYEIKNDLDKVVTNLEKNGLKGTNLSELLKGNEILNFLPNMDIDVVFNTNGVNIYMPKINQISIDKNGDIREIARVLYHETQHAAARRLGMDEGGSERAYTAFTKVFIDRYGEQLSGEGGSLLDYIKSSAGGILYARNKGEQIAYDTQDRMTDIERLSEALERGKFILEPMDGTDTEVEVLQALGFIDENGNSLSLSQLMDKYDISLEEVLTASRDTRFSTNESNLFNSEVYSPRQNESYNDYKDRMINEAIARLMGENSVEYFETIAKEAGLNKTETKSFIDKVKQFINDFAEWLKSRLGLTDVTPEQILQMTNKELFDIVTNSMFKGEFVTSVETQLQDNKTENKIKEVFTSLNNPIEIVTLYDENNITELNECR